MGGGENASVGSVGSINDSEEGCTGTEGGWVSRGSGGGVGTKQKVIRHIGQLAWRSNQEEMQVG